MTPLMPWTLPSQSLASLIPSLLAHWALPPLQSVLPAPGELLPRPLGMLEPPILGRGAVWFRRGHKLSHPPASPKATLPVCCRRSQGQPLGSLITEMMVSLSQL